MLTDLFKPAWKSNSVDKRLKAIAAMDGSMLDQNKILTQLASDDKNVAVCIAAIQKLKSAASLHEVSIKNGNDTVCAAASKSLNELMAENASLNPQEFDDLLKLHPELKVRVAAYAEPSAVRFQTIQDMSTKQFLEVLSLTVYSDSRQQIANMLDEHDALESARKIMRGKDKNAERIVKSKLDEFRRKEREQTENQDKLIKLIEEVEYLSSHDGLPEFKARCEAHFSSWDALVFDIAEEKKQQYQVSRTILDTRYNDLVAIEHAQQSQQQLLDELQSLLKEVASRDLKDAIPKLSETQENCDRINASWTSMALITSPDQPLSEQYQQITAALDNAAQFILDLQRLFPEGSISIQETSATQQQDLAQDKPEDNNEGSAIGNEVSSANESSGINPTHKPQPPTQALNTALEKLKWPPAYGALKVETEVRDQLQEWQKAQQEMQDTYHQKLAKVHKNISLIFHFSRIGNLPRAKQMSARVEKALDNFDGKDRAALKERLEEAHISLEDMGDWKNFATEPKYIELCEAMELLVDSKQHPDKRSSAMKELQKQWKALGHSDISDQYWPRFKAASDAVYQPCAIFFDERHTLRKTNLEQRQGYVEQMRELLELTNKEDKPDYKMVASTARSIIDHFVAIKEVERNPGQKQWEQFSKLKDEVFAKLDLVYDANLELKQQLINQAQALAQATVKEENLATLKTLQFRWKQVGITKRNQDQKAWRLFKSQGDLIYNQVQELRQDKRDETDQKLNAYRDIINAILKLAKTATVLSEADHQFGALQASYAELPELPNQLPEKLIEGIQRDYQKACSKFHESHARIISNMQNRQLEALRRKAELCTQLETLGETLTPQQLEPIMQEWDALQLHDAELSRRIEERRKSTQTSIDRAAMTAQRRLMCIQLEILQNVETPTEDKAERMKIQLEQMNTSGLGRQTLNYSEQIENMQLDWLCMPGAEPQQQTTLNERFWSTFDSNHKSKIK